MTTVPSALPATRIPPLLQIVYWIVVANSFGGAFVLILLPHLTDVLFFWNIAPPINAMWIGIHYGTAGAVVVAGLLSRQWERLRFIAPMVASVSTLLVITTLLHRDRFHQDWRLYYWLILYIVVPIATVYFFVERERTADHSVAHPVKPATRALAAITGALLAVFVVIAMIAPDVLVSVWPWQVSPLMIRVFGSYTSVLSAGLLWFLRECEWTRVRNMATALIAACIFLPLLPLVRSQDVSTPSPALWLYIASYVLIGVVGVLMHLLQRDRA